MNNRLREAIEQLKLILSSLDKEIKNIKESKNPLKTKTKEIALIEEKRQKVIKKLDSLKE